jgi:hypothetical protein
MARQATWTSGRGSAAHGQKDQGQDKAKTKTKAKAKTKAKTKAKGCPKPNHQSR